MLPSTLGVSYEHRIISRFFSVLFRKPYSLHYVTPVFWCNGSLGLFNLTCFAHKQVFPPVVCRDVRT